jgi:serine/threonine protein kinase
MALLSTLAGRFSWVQWNRHHSNELGHGTFGTCYRGTLRAYDGPGYRRAEMAVAVKCLDHYEAEDHIERVKFMREIEVMTLEHPAILSLVAWGIYEDRYCLVTRQMATDISRLLQDQQASPTTRSIVALGIAAGMEFLHANGVIHRDLKPANVFLSPENRPVVADFGNARFLTVNEMSTACGTCWYMAPEVFEGTGYDKSIDVYAWGMVFWRLVTTRDLYSRAAEPEMFAQFAIPRHVIAGRRPNAALILDPAKRTLIQSCWSHDPMERPSFTKILEHPEILMIDGCDRAEFSAYRGEILNGR